MLFGKHINKFYIKYGLWLLLGIATLFAVDYFQLLIPECYRMVINGVKNGVVDVGGGVTETFDLDFLFRRVCVPMFVVIVVMVFGRFLWRMCFFGSGSKVERDLRRKMFDKAKDLSVSYYQREKSAILCRCLPTTSKRCRTASAAAFLWRQTQFCLAP